jgi:enoyl-CoA hydratase/carnithine racemase
MERPDVRNAVDPATAEALVAEFEAFNRDPQAKVAVFFGTHGTFCAGWDLNYGATLTGRDVRRELDLDFPQGTGPMPRGPMGPTRLELDKPIIGAVAGAARRPGRPPAAASNCVRVIASAHLAPPEFGGNRGGHELLRRIISGSGVQYAHRSTRARHNPVAGRDDPVSD